MAGQEKLPFEEADELELDEEYEELRRELRSRLEGFADEHDLPEGVLAALLLEMALMSRTLDYLGSVEKPSGSGLRLELDRFRRDIDEVMRAAKKGADALVAEAKQAMAEDEAEAAAEADTAVEKKRK